MNKGISYLKSQSEIKNMLNYFKKLFKNREKEMDHPCSGMAERGP